MGKNGRFYTGVFLADDLRRRLAEAAAREERPMGHIMRRALAAELARLGFEDAQRSEATTG